MKFVSDALEGMEIAFSDGITFNKIGGGHWDWNTTVKDLQGVFWGHEANGSTRVGMGGGSG